MNPSRHIKTKIHSKINDDFLKERNTGRHGRLQECWVASTEVELTTAVRLVQ